jgi:UDP-N-acetyl-2-amino-2-deoxyglucuronate dehydrogenase
VTLGFGIVGCGGAAVDVARAIDAVAGARLVAAHDRVPGNAADLAAPRAATVHASVESLLADPSVDVVYVGLPHDLLAPTALRALEADRHVLVEKPMALRIEDVRAIADAAIERGRAAGVLFELREVAAIRAAHELVTGGAIGEVRQVRVQTVIDKAASYWRSGPSGRVIDDWRSRRDRAGGGVVLMNSIHQLDLVRWITGSPYVRVMADMGAPTPGVEVEDRGVALLRLDGGAQVALAAQAHSPGARSQERIEIDGTLGRLDLPDPYTPGPLKAYFRRPWGEFAQDRWHDIAPPTVDPHVAYLERYTSAVAEGRAAPVGTAAAAAALSAVLAIYRSSSSGEAVVLDEAAER